MKRKSITALLRAVSAGLSLALCLGLTGCGTAGQPAGSSSVVQAASGGAQAANIVTSLPQMDMTAWQYNEEADVYWQVGIPYCETPANESYETLGIFVPGAYMTATANGDGTYTCQRNDEGSVAGYTALTAPMVIPVDTPGYSAMAAPTGYKADVAAYTAAGFVYIAAGCRGRNEGAPAGITDLKAALRYVRYNASLLPGDTERIFSFGMSGGGAQSALLGATGDSDLYTPYLNAIGAVQGVSDAVAGSMCWCPITNLDVADAAYEWNMGVTRTGLSEQEQALSDGLAEAFAQYINALGLVDENGSTLSLEPSGEGIYQAGSYYTYIKGVIERSLNNFLADTTFPYTPSAGGMGGRMDGGAGFTGGMTGELDGMKGELGGAKGELDGAEGPGGNEQADFYEQDGINRTEPSGGQSLSGTYETPEDYIAALNADGAWLSYDSASNTVTVTSVAAFAASQKQASKALGAFDQLDGGQGENILFGYGDGAGAHFDALLAGLLTGTEYEAAFAQDLARTDAQGNTVDVRMNMYNPMYYLCDYYEGVGTAQVAQFWRIRTGIMQGDTALCTEVDLALALAAYGAQVDFETVWGQAHVMAERTGSSSENFIAWVNDCMAQ